MVVKPSDGDSKNGKQVDDPNAIDLDIDKKFLGLPIKNGKQVDDPNAIDLDIDKKFLGLPIKSAVGKFQLLPEFLKYFATGMRMLRRAGKIGEFVNVFVNEKQGCLTKVDRFLVNQMAITGQSLYSLSNNGN